MRPRLCELKSIGLSYSRLHAIQLEIPLSTIKSTCQIEARRASTIYPFYDKLPYALLQKTKEIPIVEAITITPEMLYNALKAQEAPNASVRLIGRL